MKNEKFVYTPNRGDYNLLTTNRRLDQSFINKVIDLKNCGGDNKKIMKKMREQTGKQVQLKDIQNIIQKNTAPKSLNSFIDNLDMASLNESIKKQIKIDGQDNFNFSFDDKDQSIYIIFYQTEEMRRVYQNYGQILFVDGTYKINIHNDLLLNRQ